MRIVTLIIACLFCLATAGRAQNRQIDFESTRLWGKIIEKAKKENKIIFVDCYTDWCGPCKRLATEVFSRDEVADFFNKNFVNAKLNMEKDRDGIINADKWGVTAYPTLVFIDPNNEEIVHKIIGAGEPQWLIKAGQTAIDPQKRLSSMLERYNSGRRGPIFVGEFIEALNSAGMKDEVTNVIENYFVNMSPEEMATAENWLLISQYAKDPLSVPITTVWNNKELFYNISGQNQKEAVDEKLVNIVVQTAVDFVQNPTLTATLDRDRYERFLDFLDNDNSKAKEMAAIWLNSSVISESKEWEKLIEVIQVVEEEQLLPKQMFMQYLAFFSDKLAKSNKRTIIDNFMKWLNEQDAKYGGNDLDTYYNKVFIVNVKMIIYNGTNNTSKLKAAQKELEELLAKIQEFRK